MTKYARDEFDKVPEAASRQGVHRTASAPSRVRLWPILAVGVAALAIGLVSFLILPKLGFNATATEASASVESTALAGTGSTASATQATTPPAASEPSATAEPSRSSSPEPTPSATRQAVVDRTQPVAIYNAAGTAGLASRIGGTVQADGWRLGQVGNWSGAPQKSSVIYYAGPQQLAGAQELSALLNIPAVVSSTEFQAPLVVVLGPGYR
ncbi:LytR C-terminal domain-containing protein [Pseudarthrobacter sp. fls2-241-R2A-127]|uniref:LytR C-terminal domain-containing protein n=1 Tax=Pseudarthrobacter sp. fls2-241-R2A-127 TaxID=3040303 RepID=UPI002555841B|nr:LytR C-terminal domain-containing protein [Pseudarthrobacter sp. fls2-241-R2A-127]